MFHQDMEYQLNGGFFMGCNEISKKQHGLVGGIPIPLKNMSSSVGVTIANIWKVIKFMFQTTDQPVVRVYENGVLYRYSPQNGHGIGDNFRTHRWI